MLFCFQVRAHKIWISSSNCSVFPASSLCAALAFQINIFGFALEFHPSLLEEMIAFRTAFFKTSPATTAPSFPSSHYFSTPGVSSSTSCVTQMISLLLWRMEEKRAGTAAGHWAGEALRDSHHPEGVKSRIVGLKAELLVLKAELLGLFGFFLLSVYCHL